MAMCYTGSRGPKVRARGRIALRTVALLAPALLCASAGVRGYADTLIHRYAFDESADDDVGGAHGTLVNGPAIQDGAVVLNGVNQYVDLPNNLLSPLTSLTVEMWVMDEGTGVWGRIFDFGNSSGGEDFPIGFGTQGTQYLFLSSPSGLGNLRGAITLNSYLQEQIMEDPSGPLPVGAWTHVVWATDGAAGIGRLYLDGQIVGSNTAMTLTPGDMGATVNNWIGRSQWNDPFFRGRFAEFRIYDYAIPHDLVQQNFAAGPDQPPFEGPVRITAEPEDQTVREGRIASFTARAAGTDPVQLKWARNGDPMPGATNETLVFTASVTDDQAVYRLHATNTFQASTHTAVSLPAVLTVLPDLTPPTLVTVQSLGTSGVSVQYSEPVRVDGATDLTHYTLTGPEGTVPIIDAVLSAEGERVTLETAALTSGSRYELTVLDVQDRSAAGNTIPPGTSASFTATTYTVRDIGDPAVPGRIEASGSGTVIVAAGTGAGSAGDQLTLATQSMTGDFDLRVRVLSIELSDLWAGAGLMARAGYDPGEMFAAVFTTPGPAGCYFQSRTAAGVGAVKAGFFPANHPYTWLRLRRRGNVFTGFAGIDGSAWTRLGSITVALPGTVEVGLAAASGHPTRTTTARFGDSGDVTDPAETAIAELPFEPPGPSSRNIGLVISEIMYHPRDVLSETSLEFVELHNPEGIFEDLGGFRLAGDIDFTFPEGTVIPGGGHLVVARYPEAVASAYGLNGVMGPYLGNLPNDGGTVRLRNELGGVMLEVDYQTRAPWPPAADGTGHSLVLRRPSYGENNSRAWGLSDVVDGSPGRGDGIGPEPLRDLCINEFLAHTDDPLLDQIELYNRGPEALDLGGVILSDQPDEDRFAVPPGTVLPKGGYLVFDQGQLGFALKSAGGWICVKNPAGTRVLDAVRYRGQENGVSTGRYPDGGPELARLQSRSFGAANPRFAVSPVGINELMPHPLSGEDDDQYVELHNRSGQVVDLSGWTFTDGIDFTCPPGTSIAGGGYLVVARSRARLLSRYPALGPGLVLGDFGGRLTHRGERLALAKPDEVVELDAFGQAVTNEIEIVVDEVAYGKGGRWGRWADGGGSSLELVDPRADKRFVPNWANSDETAKAPWTLVEATDVLNHGMNSNQGTPNRFEMLLQGAGECLVDEVECRQGGGTNRIGNPGFESGTTGWTAQGTHRRSLATTEDAYAGSGALHVIASGRGDTGANRIRTAISELNTGQTATLRARARWLKGNPHLLLRVRGNWMEAAGVLDVPTALGTPGGRNSRWAANAPPAVVEVGHAPVQPAAGEPVRVTARVDDPDGVASVVLTYRRERGGAVDLAMRDDGVGADVRAADGLFTAEIPGQSSGTLIAFYILARDPLNALARFPDHSPAAEGLIRFGEDSPYGSLGSYHIWCTQDTLSTWSSRERNSNDPLECTFVYGNARVIYGAGILYSGSPFHTGQYTGPLGEPCDYELEFPTDDEFLGTDDFVVVAQDARNPSFFLRDPTAQAEATAYWIGRKLGQIYNHKRWVRVLLNGRERGTIYEDTQQPNADFLDLYFPDDPNARLHKIEDWFEFDDAGAGFDYTTATLEPFTTAAGEKKRARYRWNFRPRATRAPDDFTALYPLVDVFQAAAPEPYTSATRTLTDLSSWLRCVATHHIVGDWDSYGYRRGKNMYIYKPGEGPWQLLLWDIDFALGGANVDGPEHDLFDTSGEGCPEVRRMFNHPPFRREYLAILQDAAEGPLAPGAADPVLDARYDLFIDHGLPVNDTAATIKSYIARRRDYILSQIPGAAFAVDGPDTRTLSDNLLTLTGTAPIDARSILVNGIAYVATWTAVTRWSLDVPLPAGTHSVMVQALDRDHAPLPRGSRTLTVTAVGAPPSARDWVVINEIMHHPAVPGAAFVELLNTHSTAAFDLSGWRVNGLDFAFPDGSWVPAGGFRVVAEDRFAYAKAYGAVALLDGECDGRVDPEGETLTLYELDQASGTETVVDRVRYEAVAPWPFAAGQPGVALQLVDANQDNSRVGNWAVTTESAGPQWVRAFATGTASSSRLYMYLESAGDVYLDDVRLVAGSDPDSGRDLLVNGGFESSLSGSWTVSANLAASAITTSLRHSGRSCLHLVASYGGSSRNTSIWQAISPSLIDNATYTLSFWYRENDNGGPLVVRLSGSGARASVDPGAGLGGAGPATPGAANATAGTRAPFPDLWLNEVQPVPARGPVNGEGEHVPWFELVNAGPDPLSLDGLYLSADPGDLPAMPFPSSAALAAGEFRLVFADGRTDLASPEEWHAEFTLASDTGMVLLARMGADGPEVVDYLSYAGVPVEHSYGDVPDAQPFYRQVMYRATPGLSNLAAVAPVDVTITEWMADNSGSGGLVDPADGDSDDWFELYNAGAVEADLGGYFLTDDLDTPLRFEIPQGYRIPPGGYLLVWADSEPEQNAPTTPDLHVTFRLSAGGEAIGLFAPDRTPIDTVVFGPQAEDVSQGPLPVPTGPIVAMIFPTPGGRNYLTAPPTLPRVFSLVRASGPVLLVRYSTLPGAAYRVETTTAPGEGTPVPLGPDRMAFSDDVVETAFPPNDDHRVYHIRRVR